MKTLTLSLFILLFSAAHLRAQDTAEAPPVDEIAETYIETIGGADAWKELDALRMNGKATMQGMTFPFTITSAEGDKTRFEMDIQGNQMVQAYDGVTAWTYFPMQGITEPKAMTDEEAIDMKENPFLDVFIDAEDRGYSLEQVEGREVEGTPTYGVRVTNDEGFERTYYFDTETMVPILYVMTSKGGQMKGVTMETYLSDYAEYEGLYFPMFMEQKVNGQTVMSMTMDEVMIDPEVEDAYFTMDSIEEED